MFNAAMDDIATAFNTPQPTAYGGTGATSAVGGWDALSAKGIDIASASTINLTTATGARVDITGTTTITGVTMPDGAVRFGRTTGIVQFTASATLLINKSAATNLTSAVGDQFMFTRDGSVVSVTSLGGGTLASTTQAGIVELATNAETIAGTSSTLVPTVNNLYFPTGYISGFLMTPDADASNDFSMAVGSARSSDDTTNIVLGSALIKQVDATWVVGTNQGGRFYTTLVAGSQVYAYIIKDPVNNLIDWGYSDNATNPTGGASYPAAYTKYTRVAGFWRSAGSVNQAPRVYSREADFADGQWTLYTPTYTSFGTATGSSVFSRRVGDTLQIRGKFTAGTTTGGEARMTLGYNGVNANVNSDATKVSSLQAAGLLLRSASVAGSWNTLIESNVGYLTFGAQTSSTAALAKLVGTAVIASGDLSITADVPISGW